MRISILALDRSNNGISPRNKTHSLLSCQRASENRIRKILGQTSEEKEKRKFSVKRSKENKRKKEFSIKRRNKAKEKERFPINGRKRKKGIYKKVFRLDNI